MKKNFKIFLCLIFLFTISACQKEDHTHQFSDQYSYDETYHFYPSTCGHDEKKDVEKHHFYEVLRVDATEETAGFIKYQCEVCGYEYETTIPVLSHTHQFSDQYSYDETYHFYPSTCGHDEKKDVEKHHFYEVLRVDATEETAGFIKYQCEVCGYEYETTIPVLPHTHQFSDVYSSDETYHFYPSTCDHDIKKDLEEHDFLVEVIKKATIYKEGEALYTCQKCNYQKIVFLDKTSLDYLEINAYNTEAKISNFSTNCGLRLFSSAYNFSSDLLTLKVAFKEVADGFEVVEVKNNNEKIINDYDYLLVSWKNDETETFQKLLAFNLKIGDKVQFSTDLSLLREGEINLSINYLSQTFKINYHLDYEYFETKDDLFVSFFTDYYYFLLNNTNCDFSNYKISSVDDFLTYCMTWDAGGRNELAGVGNAFGSYYLVPTVGGSFSDQPTSHFIGYCYQNQKYLDFLAFLEVFFAYWRTDEGYTTETNNGNDFFASSWAAFVDTCKFFYFTSETLTDKYAWFTYTRSPRVHEALDNVPNVGQLYLPLYGTIGNSVTLPELTRKNYTFLGWYDELGNRVYQASGNIDVYAKFEQNVKTVTFKSMNEVIKTIKVFEGSRVTSFSISSDYLFDGWLTENMEMYDFLNAVEDDIILYAAFSNQNEEIGNLKINAYNTQGKTDGFAEYEGLELFKSGTSLQASLYWYKIGLVYQNNTYYISEIALSGESLTKSYDYLLLAYRYDSTGMYEKLVSLNLTVNDIVIFDTNLSQLKSGSVDINVTFKVSKQKIYNLYLETDVDLDKKYAIVEENKEVVLPILTKNGYEFLGWYETKEYQNKVTSYIVKENKIFYAYFVPKTIETPLDYVSDIVTSTTLDILPRYDGLKTLSWSSSDPNLYYIDNDQGKTLRMYQTHQKQTVMITVEITENGTTIIMSKEITINPVQFETMENPKATYFSVSSTSSYQQYNERYLKNQTLFSDKFQEHMDMVYYAFAIPQSDGTLSLNTKYIDEVIKLKNNGIRVLLVIDGANSTPLKAMVQLCNDDSTRKTFVDNIVNLVLKYNFDGVDIDWEFPGTSGLSGYTTEIDRTNLNKLLRDLRNKLSENQDEDGSNYILSIAAPSTYWGTNRYDYDGRYSGDVGGINDYCDYVNMMSYDLNKSSSTSHLAHLYSPDNSYSYKFSVDYGVTYFTSLGLDKNKIIIGSAAYGKAYTLTGTVDMNASLPALGVTGTLGQVLGYNLPTQSITWKSGTIYYTGIMELLNSNNFIQYNEYNNKQQFVGSYLYSQKDQIFITFDSELAIKEKCKYAKNHGMGIMVWAYGEDATDTIINTICDNLP